MATDIEAAVEAAIAASDGADVAAGSAEHLARYVELLARWNRAYNLSAVRDPEAMVTRHIADSLSVRPWLRGENLLDIGSGPGVPGLILALIEPERSVTLLDSSGKKARFLNQVVIELALPNVVVVQNRADQVQMHSGFDTVISRAFASLNEFWRVAEPLLAPSGQALAMKGRYPEAELAALPADGLSCAIERLEVPGLDGERHLVRLASAPF